MVNRWFGIATLAGMLAANAALFVRDMLPGLLAGDAPTSSVFTLASGEKQERQTGIFAEDGSLIGYSWTVAERSLELLTVRTTTVLDRITTQGGTYVPRLEVFVEYAYNREGRLDNLHARVFGLGIPIGLRGEYVPPDAFPCEWQFDTASGSFVIPAELTGQLSDSFRPVQMLAGLVVGQTWRMEVINPLAGLASKFGASDMASTTLLVRVTREEFLEFGNASRRTVVVETDRFRAWVCDNGEVLRQEIDLPLIGKLSMVAQPFDAVLKRRKASESMRD